MRRPPPRPGRPAATAARNASCDGPMPAAESRSGAHSSSAERAQVVHRDRVDARHHLVGVEQRQVVQRRAAEAVHARGGGLQREHDARLDVLACARQLLLGRRLARAGASSSAPTTSIASARLSGPRADVEADLARVGELARERVDRVGQAALLAHALEQPRRRQPAEDRVEHAHGEAALVAARQARARRGRRAPARCPWPGSARAPAAAAGAGSGTGARSPARSPPSVRSASATISSWSTEPAAATTTDAGT